MNSAFRAIWLVPHHLGIAIKLVLYILKQLFAPVSVSSGGYLPKRLGKYPPLFTDTEANNIVTYDFGRLLISGRSSGGWRANADIQLRPCGLRTLQCSCGRWHQVPWGRVRPCCAVVATASILVVWRGVGWFGRSPYWPSVVPVWCHNGMVLRSYGVLWYCMLSYGSVQWNFLFVWYTISIPIWNGILFVQYSAVQCSAVQCSTVQYSAVYRDYFVESDAYGFDASDGVSWYETSEWNCTKHFPWCFLLVIVYIPKHLSFPFTADCRLQLVSGRTILSTSE